MIPIDLKTLYGDKYKITLDPAAKLERGGRHDPWQYVLPCRYGEIYPFNDRQLAIMVIGSKKVTELKWDGFHLHQDADGEAVFLFTLDRFDEVAKMAKAKMKKRISAAHLRKLQDGAAAYRKTG